MALDPTGIFSHNYRQHRGISWKNHVRCATTANITIATALNAGDTIDGVTLAAGDRVLVKDQATATGNGIYIAGASPVRAADMDQDLTTDVPAEEIAGAFVYVAEGTVNGGTLWHTTNPNGDTIGSDNIVWEEFSGGEDKSLVIVAATGSTETVDCSVARTYDLTLMANCTITLTGAVAGEAHWLTILLRQDATGSRTVTWPGSVTWFGGSAPTLQTAANALDTVLLLSEDGGTTWLGWPVGGSAALSDDTPLVASGAGDPGVSDEASRSDHVHPTEGSSGSPQFLLESGHAVPFTFDEMLQESDGSDFLYASA